MNSLRRDASPPRPPPLSYATHLPRVSAGALKRIARVWVGKAASKLHKDACIQAICQGLSDPAAVRRAVDSLSDFEPAGLGLLKRHGQSAHTDALAMELLMLGLPFKDDGAGIGTIRIVMKQSVILLAHKMAGTARCAGAPRGATARGSCGPRSGSGTNPRTGTTPSAFAVCMARTASLDPLIP